MAYWVAINLSARNLLDVNCVQAFEEALTRHRLPPEQVELELTESSVMHDPQRAVSVLNEFRRYGVNVAIDDFGTGYSSLTQLRQLSVNALKIDRSFVTQMLTDSQDEAIVRSTIALAHSLGLIVIAEGVESDDVLDMLGAMRCDQAQGFGICRPIPLDELIGWLGAARYSASAS